MLKSKKKYKVWIWDGNNEDNEATFGYNENLKTWFLKAFNKKLIIGTKYNEIKDLNELFCNLYMKDIKYEVTDEIIDEAIIKDNSLRKNDHPLLKKYGYGSQNPEVLELIQSLDIMISLELGKINSDDITVLNAKNYIIAFGNKIQPMSLYLMQLIFYSYVNSKKYTQVALFKNVVYASLNYGWNNIGPWQA